MSTMSAALVLFLFFSSAAAQTLNLINNYTGSTFFDKWTFYNGIDANTTGNVLYQTREQALQLGLTTVNNAGNVVIKVDNTTSGVGDPTYGRASVKILSNDTIQAGSLLIMDAVHLPFGCSVWPAFWTQGSNWPDDGEIDIVENVNLAPTNRYALHTLQGCMHPPASSNSTYPETGTLIAPDCFNQTNGNEGCLVNDPSTVSYGSSFANNGGGVWATLWDSTGIRIWFFPRQLIPADISNGNPSPGGWGAPVAYYPQATCDTTKFFGPQTIIFDITICGNFAGDPAVFNPSCSGSCLDLVQAPTNYDNAYFEIKYVAVYSNSTAPASSSGSGTATSPSASGSSGSTGMALELKTPTMLLSVLAGLLVPAAAAMSIIV